MAWRVLQNAAARSGLSRTLQGAAADDSIVDASGPYDRRIVVDEHQ
jgi:hypothetical protein